MGRSIHIVLLAIAVGSIGCSSSREVVIRQTSEGTFYDLRKAPMSIPGSVVHLIDGTDYPVEGIELGSNQLSWSVAGSTRTVPIDSVNRISGKNHVIGAVEGLGIGLLLGCGAGLIVGALGSSTQTDSYDQMSVWIATLGIGSVAGAVFGGTFGGLRGHEYDISFIREGE